MKWNDLDLDELKRRIDAITRLRATAEKIGVTFSQSAGVAASSEEWPEVVLEDILDAEVIGDE